MSPSKVVTLVHGTFARNADWIQADAPLPARIREEFGEDVHVVPFNWSGENSVFARTKASEELASHLEKLKIDFPKSTQYIVAHSHGGNIALYAASQLSGGEISGIVCLATPFLQASPRDISAVTEQRLRESMGALFAAAAFLIALAAGSGFLWAVFWVVIAGAVGVACAYRVAILLRIYAPYAGGAAARIDARAPDGTDVLVVRAVGDEASLGLGAAQLLSWASSKIFDWLSASNKLMLPESGIAFPKFRLRRVPLPKALRWLWVLVVIFPLFSPFCSAAFGRQPIESDLQIAYIGLFIAFFGTVAIKTNLLDGSLLGASLVFFAICVLLTARFERVSRLA